MDFFLFAVDVVHQDHKQTTCSLLQIYTLKNKIGHNTLHQLSVTFTELKHTSSSSLVNVEPKKFLKFPVLF